METEVLHFQILEIKIGKVFLIQFLYFLKMNLFKEQVLNLRPQIVAEGFFNVGRHLFPSVYFLNKGNYNKTSVLIYI